WNPYCVCPALRAECSPTAALQRMGTEIAENLAPGEQRSPEQLLCDVAERAETYYRTVWASCSKAEKVTLVHLAQHGLVNPKGDEAIQQLLRKGLLVRDPVCRIMNETFRRFVLKHHDADELRSWEQEAGDNWGSVRAGVATVLIGLALLLFIAQHS